jgi:hypothetical protein
MIFSKGIGKAFEITQEQQIFTKNDKKQFFNGTMQTMV